MNFDKIIAVRNNKTIYRDGDKVIKLFDKSFSKADILNEALNNSKIEETNIDVPKFINVIKVEDRWAIISEYIEGNSLSQLMAKYPEKRSEYLKLFVSLHVNIHKHTQDSLNKLSDKLSYRISKTDFDANTRYELQTRLNSMPKHKKICHGDFCPNNVIINKEGKPYCIDWSHATQGNASADVAKSYIIFLLNYGEEVAKEYLDLYCQMSEIPKEYIEKWIPIVAAAQSVKVLNKKDREYLKGLVDVVDYE